MMPLPAAAWSFRPAWDDILAHVAAAQPLGDGAYSLCLPLPGLGVVGLPQGLPEAWSWARPSEGLSMIGLGEALRRDCASAADLAETLAGLAWRCDDPEGCGDEPAAFIGHAFDDQDPSGLPPALLLLPRLLLRCRHDRATLVFSHVGGGCAEAVRQDWLEAAARLFQALEAPVTAVEDNEVVRLAECPSAEQFVARVTAARTAIAGGEVKKVVLSRRVTLHGSRPFDPARLSAALEQRYPSCAVFVAAFGARTLVAASPERLAARRGGRIESHALAGTSRCDAAEPFLGRRLLTSGKDRHEHDLVVQWIAAALAQVSDEIEQPAEPQLMTLGPLQHLWTPIFGLLRPGRGLLDAALRLHPTPAVAGLPLAAAKTVLARLGESRSGWYSGAFGWVSPSGDGELAVVLRCAMLDGDQAELSIGAGIVAASEPTAELAETELKLQAVLQSLRVA
jgi:menaquinone-specific isochorismate synthase